MMQENSIRDLQARIDQLEKDNAAYSNAHDVLAVERNDAIAKRLATFERAAGLEKRIEQLEEALRRIGDAGFRYCSDEDEDTQLSMRISDARAALAAADGQKLQDFRERTIDQLQRFKVPADTQDSGTGDPFPLPVMQVCPICGNKRCPHAHHTKWKCTGSNELDQPKSLRGKPCTCPGSTRECHVSCGGVLGELWYCQKKYRETP